MGSLGNELSLGSRNSSMPITICDFPSKSSKIMNVAEHVIKLEEEKRKIQCCEFELPLCLQILNNAISYLKEEDKSCSEMDTQPLLKDFISLSKPIRDELSKEKKFQQWKANDLISNRRFSKIKNKPEIKRNEEKSSNAMRNPKVETCLGLGLTSSSIVNGRSKGISSCAPFLQHQALRKQRRCWNSELHRRFVDALQHLGGPRVATPKQIREHMQEEGLTNDEVKSHLQKYRLHIRKPNSNAEKENQSVVVLGFKFWKEGGGESSKRSDSKSDSPQGPLELHCTTSGDSSMGDAKSESF